MEYCNVYFLFLCPSTHFLGFSMMSFGSYDAVFLKRGILILLISMKVLIQEICLEVLEFRILKMYLI
jgi:hypothetical protein